MTVKYINLRFLTGKFINYKFLTVKFINLRFSNSLISDQQLRFTKINEIHYRIH